MILRPRRRRAGRRRRMGGALAGRRRATKAKGERREARERMGTSASRRGRWCACSKPRESGEREDEESSESESERRGDCRQAGDAALACASRTVEEEATKEEDEESEEEDDGTMDSDFGGRAQEVREQFERGHGAAHETSGRTRPMGTCRRDRALTDDETPHVDHIRVFRTSADGSGSSRG